jgi:hypothetical protein
MAYRTWKLLTSTNSTMTERAACRGVSVYGDAGLSLPMPYVVAVLTMVVHASGPLAMKEA